MPILENNYIKWGEIIEDYVDKNNTKIEAQSKIRYDDLEWSLIKQRFYKELA